MAKIELERLISKRGLLSRKEAALAILKGLVKVNGQICKIPLIYVDHRCNIEIEGQKVVEQKKHYLMLNKPKGLITTRSDEKNRPTVYDCLKNWSGPLVQAVGRLDQASEGLLLFTNDHVWAEKLMNPITHVTKIYHVQASPIPADIILEKLSKGIVLEGKKTLPAKFELIRAGEKNGWIEIHLDEGRNRQIRKMLETENIEVLRLIRIQIGEIKLNDLAKGEWRELTEEELTILR
ncbi:MAG: rRNA pseudouridine synthase [Bacteriovorax sp.]|nr:rRNA pseudouridine synthase [Bacteriovorax sp.]